MVMDHMIVGLVHHHHLRKGLQKVTHGMIQHKLQHFKHQENEEGQPQEELMCQQHQMRQQAHQDQVQL